MCKMTPVEVDNLNLDDQRVLLYKATTSYKTPCMFLPCLSHMYSSLIPILQELSCTMLLAQAAAMKVTDSAVTAITSYNSF